MPKGGARTRSGIPPDPNALSRERDAGEWTILPASGRQGPCPEWPLPDGSAREWDLWQMLWRKPQALMWERNGQEHEVAVYARRFAEAEVAGSMVTLNTLVRQMTDSLGLSTPGMRMNRWKIESGEAAQQPTRMASRRSARDRFKVVDGDGA